jgi:hypothetical protein
MIFRNIAVATLGAVLAAGAAEAEPILRIEHAAARVVVIPEARGDVVYTIQPGRAGLPPLQIRRDGGATVLDGGLAAGFGPFGLPMGLSCHGAGDHVRVRIPGHGEVALQDLPVVTARVPLSAQVAVGEAVFGEIGPSQSLDFSNAGCGDWRIADVRGAAAFALSGSGDIRARNVGAATVRISGSSDVYFGGVQGALEARVSGSGDVHAAWINGPLSARISGSGDVTVDGGVSPSVVASIAGSGDVRFRGTAGALQASIAGSGDVDVARVTGEVTKRIAGSGDVNIGR